MTPQSRLPSLRAPFIPKFRDLPENKADWLTGSHLIDGVFYLSHPILSFSCRAWRVLPFGFTPKIFQVKKNELSIAFGEEPAATPENIVCRVASL
jgi:hypothetical protein